MKFADRMKRTASDLVDKYGNSMMLINIITGNYHADTGERAYADASYPIKGSMTRYTVAEYGSDHVQAGDMKATIETDLIPNREWQVEWNKERYKIINIVEVSAQDVTIIYILQLRK